MNIDSSCARGLIRGCYIRSKRFGDSESFVYMLELDVQTERMTAIVSLLSDLALLLIILDRCDVFPHLVKSKYKLLH